MIVQPATAAALARLLAWDASFLPVRADGDVFSAPGGRPTGRPTVDPLDPADDHRVAMALAVAGTVVPGVRIASADCVAKSWPEFWPAWRALVKGAR